MRTKVYASVPAFFPYKTSNIHDLTSLHIVSVIAETAEFAVIAIVTSVSLIVVITVVESSALFLMCVIYIDGDSSHNVEYAEICRRKDYKGT